jgi:ATP-binding cassette subfamily F protein 3
MSLIVADSITKTWSDRDVLRNVCATLSPNERVGLVGPNGHGKTTLIRILAGVESATWGTIQKKTGLRIGYLPQDAPLLEGSTLRQAMLDVFADLAAIETEMHVLADQLTTDGSNQALLKRYGDLQHEFEDRDGYSYSHKIDQVLTGLRLDRKSVV